MISLSLLLPVAFKAATDIAGISALKGGLTAIGGGILAKTALSTGTKSIASHTIASQLAKTATREVTKAGLGSTLSKVTLSAAAKEAGKGSLATAGKSLAKFAAIVAEEGEKDTTAQQVLDALRCISDIKDFISPDNEQCIDFAESSCYEDESLYSDDMEQFESGDLDEGDEPEDIDAEAEALAELFTEYLAPAHH